MHMVFTQAFQYEKRLWTALKELKKQTTTHADALNETFIFVSSVRLKY